MLIHILIAVLLSASVLFVANFFDPCRTAVVHVVVLFALCVVLPTCTCLLLPCHTCLFGDRRLVAS